VPAHGGKCTLHDAVKTAILLADLGDFATAIAASLALTSTCHVRCAHVAVECTCANHSMDDMQSGEAAANSMMAEHRVTAAVMVELHCAAPIQ
jgi:hypothetical protein